MALAASLLLALNLSVLQTEAVTPPRPALGAAQDTNDANAYYRFGVSQLPGYPRRASDAFFWATRLNPALAEAWYGRWAAQSLEQDAPPHGWYGRVIVWLPSPGEDPALRQIDSLRTKALLRNPLLHLRLDAMVIKAWATRAGIGEEALYDSEDKALRAWMEYSEGHFQNAERLYALAIRERPGYYELRLERAHAFLLHLQFDSALREMQVYLDAGRRDPGELAVRAAEMRQLTEFTIGGIEEAKGDLPAARAMYTQMVSASGAFPPAHAALARIALAQGDTAVALQEYQLATLQPDPPTCYDFGVLLLRRNQGAEAAVQLRRAIAADSDYVPPYLTLAYLEETGGSDSLAAEFYRRFIARAPRTLGPQIAAARRLLAALPGAAASH